VKCRSCRRPLGNNKLFCERCGTLAAVRLSPEEVDHLLKTSDALMHQKQARQARQLLEGLVEMESQHAPAFNQLGAVYLAARQHQKADYCFKKALFLDGSLVAAVENLKKLHSVRQHKPSPKEKQLAESLAGARRLLAEAKSGTEPDVTRAYEALLHDHPRLIEGYVDLGQWYFQNHDHDRAEDVLVRGLEQYYVGGLQVDHRYYDVKEKLGQLRDAREEGLKGRKRPDLELMEPNEQVLVSVAGDLRVARTGELRKHGVFVATNKRIVLMWPVLATEDGGPPPPVDEEIPGDWDDETIPYQSVKSVRINFGIVRAVMGLSTRTDEFYFSTLSKDEGKTALTIIRSMMRKTSEVAAVDDILVKTNDMSNKTAVLLLKALNELNVLTDDEYRHKVTSVERNGQPERQPALQPPPRRMRTEH
jgi:hypothetical protein